MAFLLGIILVSTSLATYDCMAVNEEGRPSSWLRASKALVRHERQSMNEEDSFCDHVVNCFFDFSRRLESFNVQEISEYLDRTCKPYTNCWDDRCDRESRKNMIQVQDTVLRWMCKNEEGFRNTTCYQPPFTQRMRACMDVDFHNYDYDSELSESMLFQICAFTVLDDLPGCSRNNFYARFITFLLSMS